MELLARGRRRGAIFCRKLPAVTSCRGPGHIYLFPPVISLFFSAQLASEFTIVEVRPEDEGAFHCTAQNPAGAAAANFSLVVRPPAEKIVGSAKDTSAKGVDKEGEDQEDEEDMIKVRGAHETLPPRQ